MSKHSQDIQNIPTSVYIDPNVICIDSDDSTGDPAPVRLKRNKSTRPKKTSKKKISVKPITSYKSVKKKSLENQPKITKFLDDKNGTNSYFKTHKESLMPVIITGDMNIEEVLEIGLSEKENDVIDLSDNTSDLNTKLSADFLKLKSLDDILEKHESIKSSIYSQEKDNWNLEQVDVPMKLSNPSVNTEPKIILDNTSNKKQSKAKICPKYKIIAGTTFCVDGFRFGMIDGVSHYFLTHFHSDHYIGLKKSFNMPIFLSKITAKLVKLLIGVSEDYLHIMNIGEAIVIDDIEVTAIDANHCPGAFMFVFKFTNGSCILHTGDFRASNEMESEPIFWNNSVDIIYLDTTYLSVKKNFKSQWESIVEATEIVGKSLKKYDRLLVVCGSYLIGKEKIWVTIAKEYNFLVWAEDNRRQSLNIIDECCENGEKYSDFMVNDPNQAQMHILPLQKLQYLILREYLSEYTDHFTAILALVPSGWKRSNKPRISGNILIYEIEYSEHSSYNELKRFVQFINPEQVISTVPYCMKTEQTPSVPRDWHGMKNVKPTRNYQPQINSIFRKKL